MTGATATAVRLEPSDYVQVWADSFSQVMGQIVGAQLSYVALAEAPVELTPPGENDLWTVCTCSGTLRGEMSLRLSAASALAVAQLFMSEPAAPDAQLSAEHREAVVEFLRQVAGIVASSIKVRWGEIQVRLDPSPGPASWPASSTAWLQAEKESPAAVLVELHLSAALVASLRADQSETAKPTSPSATPTASSSAENETKLQLLMDVELALTLRFGGRRLLLREVLELSPGAVVELDRQVQDPVDLLLDGKLVARGEVVVVDGNYGLRVTELVPAGAI